MRKIVAAGAGLVMLAFMALLAYGLYRAEWVPRQAGERLANVDLRPGMTLLELRQVLGDRGSISAPDGSHERFVFFCHSCVSANFFGDEHPQPNTVPISISVSRFYKGSLCKVRIGDTYEKALETVRTQYPDAKYNGMFIDLDDGSWSLFVDAHRLSVQKSGYTYVP